MMAECTRCGQVKPGAVVGVTPTGLLIGLPAGGTTRCAIRFVVHPAPVHPGATIAAGTDTPSRGQHGTDGWGIWRIHAVCQSAHGRHPAVSVEPSAGLREQEGVPRGWLSRTGQEARGVGAAARFDGLPYDQHSLLAIRCGDLCSAHRWPRPRAALSVYFTHDPVLIMLREHTKSTTQSTSSAMQRTQRLRLPRP